MDRDFKRRELEHELRHEDEWNKKQASMPKLIGYYFYNVPSDDVDTAASYGIKKLKSGKWGMPIYDKSGNSTAYRKRLADDAYGKGRWWEPKAKVKEDGPSVGTITNVSDKDVTFKDPSGIETKVPSTSGLISKDDKGNLVFNKAAALSQTQQQKPAQQPQQQKLAQPGQKVQINNSVEEDSELAIIMRHAGLQ